MTIDNKLIVLKAAAIAATPGPWISDDDSWSDGDHAIITTEERQDQGTINIAQIDGGGSESGSYEPFKTEQQANARFIGSANPETVLTLLAEREADKKRITELEAIATDYADKFQKAQDAAKHLIVMNDRDKKRIKELDRSETQLINERESAHAALNDLYEAATGERPKWSNLFGFADAIEEVSKVRARLVTPVQSPDDGLDDCRKMWPKDCNDDFDTGYKFGLWRYEQNIRAAGFKVHGDEQ